MDETTQKAISQRLLSAAGHIKGIERMTQEGVYCIDLIRQIQAVQAALNKASALILDNHMRTCLTTAIHGDEVTEREKMLQEIVSVFDVSNKL
jgi:DNA-binding FrmR family transcriptional regulator